MRVPDYGKGDWDIKYAENRKLPHVKEIGLRDSTIFLALSETADSIKFTGQDHKTLHLVTDCAEAEYTMKPHDAYARITAYFSDGEVIYSNPFARFDSSVADSPYDLPDHKVNIPLTVLYNLALLLLLILTGALLRKIIKK